MNKQHDFRQVRKRDIVGITAEKCATHFTRRSVLCRFAYAAAAILGAQFLVAEGFRGTAWANEDPGCNYAPNDPCGANGMLCGIAQGAIPCSGLAACLGCLQANGCPLGTAPEGSWQGCCTCANKAGSQIVIYTDCCSSTIANQTKLPAQCQPCLPLLSAGCTGGCHPGAQAWCYGTFPICDEAWGLQNYICTHHQATQTTCTPSNC